MTDSSHNDEREAADDDLVFSALGSAIRRRILDLVRSAPGLTVLEISERFDMSRFGVRKHLDTLVEAGLLTVERVGRSKKHYLNAVPIQTIYDRWLTRYSRRWAPALTELKYQLEGEVADLNVHRHRYELYIRTSPGRLWQALTDGDISRRYFYRSIVESTFEPGDPIVYRHPDDESVTLLSGEIITSEPGRRLVHTFRFDNDDPESTVTWEIEDLGDTCKLTLTHEFDEINATYKSVEDGWNPVLSGLKTYLETGEPLAVPLPERVQAS